MRFEDTKLPKTEMMEKAFDISYRSFDMRRRETYKNVEQQFEKNAKQTLKHYLDNPQISDAEKKQIEAELKRQIAEQKKALTAKANQEIATGFKNYILKPAETMVDILGDAAEEHQLAASMLAEMTHSPDDFAILKAEFPKEVVDITTDIQDLETNYSGNLSEGIAKLKNDTKIVYLSMVIGDMRSISEQAQKLGPGQMMQLQGGDEQLTSFVRNAAGAKGASKKMDDAFIAAFNQLSKDVNAGLELGENPKNGNYRVRKTPTNNTPSNAFNDAAPAPAEQPQFFIMYDPEGPVIGEKPEVRFTFVPAQPPPGM